MGNNLVAYRNCCHCCNRLLGIKLFGERKMMCILLLFCLICLWLCVVAWILLGCFTCQPVSSVQCCIV